MKQYRIKLGFAALLILTFAVVAPLQTQAAQPILSDLYIDIPCTRGKEGGLRANGPEVGAKCELGLPRCADVVEMVKASIDKGIQDYIDAAYRHGVLIDFKKAEDYFANPSPGKLPGDPLSMNVCSLQIGEGKKLSTPNTYTPNKLGQSCGKTLAIGAYGSAIGSAAVAPGSPPLAAAAAPGSWEEGQKNALMFDAMTCVKNDILDKIGTDYRLRIPVGLESLAEDFRKLYTRAKKLSAQNTKTYFKLLEGAPGGATVQNLCDQQNFLKNSDEFVPAYCSKEHLSENSSNPQDAAQRQSTCYLATTVKLATEGFVRLAIASIRILADVHFTRLTYGDNSPLATAIKNFVMTFRDDKVRSCVMANIHITITGIHFNQGGAENCWKNDIQDAYNAGIVQLFENFEKTHVPIAGKCDVH